jgi:hypothetical protein
LHNDNPDNTIWCRYYIDDFATAKVRITHVGRGKYKIVDDTEGGKYIGKVVDASDVSQFEV